VIYSNITEVLPTQMLKKCHTNQNPEMAVKSDHDDGSFDALNVDRVSLCGNKTREKNKQRTLVNKTRTLGAIELVDMTPAADLQPKTAA
jgi:hypothetical protein